jgi:hypothetical protein
METALIKEYVNFKKGSFKGTIFILRDFKHDKCYWGIRE